MECHRRMPGHSVDVIDLGLKLDEALEMGLQTEEFTRKRELPASLLPSLTQTERTYFGGVRVGRRSWVGRRVEINAMTSPQLVEYVERKLGEAGARGKVIPPDDELARLDALSRQKEAAEEGLKTLRERRRKIRELHQSREKILTRYRDAVPGALEEADGKQRRAVYNTLGVTVWAARTKEDPIRIVLSALGGGEVCHHDRT